MSTSEIPYCKEHYEVDGGDQRYLYCETCEIPYLPTLDRTECGKCSNVALCEFCDNIDSGQCGQCVSGHILNESGQCSCVLPALDCLLCNSANTRCIECAGSFLPTLDGRNCGNCETLYPGCKFCSNDNLRDKSCSFCSNGMFVDSYEECGTCHNIEHCIRCDSVELDQCAVCEQNYRITVDENNDKECEFIFVENCATVSYGACVLCDSPYTLSFNNFHCGTCELDNKNCNACDEEDPSQCYKCKKGYILDLSGKCQPELVEIPFCKVQQENMCMKCDPLFENTVNGACAPCDGYCELCSDEVVEEADMVVSKCVLCEELNGIQLVNYNGVCCGVHCLECQYRYSQVFDLNTHKLFYFPYGITCTLCEDGYLLTPYGFCSTECNQIANCLMCNPYLRECVECDQSSIVMDGRCVVCLSGTLKNKSGNACVKEHCKDINNCKFCDEKLGKCKYCITGNVISSGLECGTCSDDCKTCDSVDKFLCFECKNPLLHPSPLGGCTANLIYGCLIESSEKCVQCLENLKYNGKVCIIDEDACDDKLLEDYTNCNFCNEDEYFQSGWCEAIENKAENCSWAYSDGRCMLCNQGFELDSNRNCEFLDFGAKIKDSLNFGIGIIIVGCSGLLIASVIQIYELFRKSGSGGGE